MMGKTVMPIYACAWAYKHSEAEGYTASPRNPAPIGVGYPQTAMPLRGLRDKYAKAETKLLTL